MLRNEIQNKTGLTRKAIEYYEEKGLIQPRRLENEYRDYVKYLDELPTFELSKEEQDYVDEISSLFDIQMLRNVNESKIEAVENSKEWLIENKDMITKYLDYKNSDIYKDSPMQNIQRKLETFMIENKYYEIAIPLIRKFSSKYDEYYKKLLYAND